MTIPISFKQEIKFARLDNTATIYPETNTGYHQYVPWNNRSVLQFVPEWLVVHLLIRPIVWILAPVLMVLTKYNLSELFLGWLRRIETELDQTFNYPRKHTVLWLMMCIPRILLTFGLICFELLLSFRYTIVGTKNAVSTTVITKHEIAVSKFDGQLMHKRIRNFSLYSILTFMFVLLIFQAQSQSVSPVVVEDHQYFINEQFGAERDLSYWDGEWTQTSYTATVTSSGASLSFSLASWNPQQPLYFKMKSSGGNAKFISSQGMTLASFSGSTGLLDVTDNFVGYRQAVYSQALDLSQESYIPELPVMITISTGTYSYIQLWSDVDYSLLKDSTFDMDLAVTDRNYAGTTLHDLPIDVGVGTSFASLINPNARAHKLFDFNLGTVTGIDAQTATAAAGQEITLPNTPKLTLEMSAALSYKGALNINESGRSDVYYRLSFLTNGYPVVSPESAITGWTRVTSTSHSEFLGIKHGISFDAASLDISKLAGLSGRFAIEVRADWQVNLPELLPYANVYFVLLEMNVLGGVYDQPRHYNNPVLFGYDYARVNDADVEFWFPDAITQDLGSARPVLRATGEGDIATYMVDSAQLLLQNDFTDGYYYQDFIEDAATPFNTWYHKDDGLIYLDPTNTIHPLSRLIFDGVDRRSLQEGLSSTIDTRMWDRNVYLYSMDVRADQDVYDLDMGFGIGSTSAGEHYSVRVVDDRSSDVAVGTYDTHIEIWQHNLSNGQWSADLKHSFTFDKQPTFQGEQ